MEFHFLFVILARTRDCGVDDAAEAPSGAHKVQGDAAPCVPWRPAPRQRRAVGVRGAHPRSARRAALARDVPHRRVRRARARRRHARAARPLRLRVPQFRRLRVAPRCAASASSRTWRTSGAPPSPPSRASCAGRPPAPLPQSQQTRPSPPRPRRRPQSMPAARRRFRILTSMGYSSYRQR
jgi:hypothetical protein